MPGDPALSGFAEPPEISVNGVEAGTEVSHSYDLQIFSALDWAGTEENRNTVAENCALPAALIMPNSGTTRSTSLAQLRAEVLEANLELVRRGLVLYTFG